jgi:hypothetical protein
MLGDIHAIPRPIPTVGLPKIPTTITATTTSSSNSNTKLSNKLPIPKPVLHIPTNTPPDPNKPVINPITNRKSYDHITDRELRKKLKNRESAQAARDRKKAKMLTLERQLSDMAERNKLLENENRELRGRIQRMEAEAFWRLVKNPPDGSNMEGNAMAAMMNQGMHPGGMAGHNGMIPGQNMESAPPADMHQIQISEHARAEQQKLYQRQMQFLLEGNPAAAAAFHGQVPNSGNNQMGTQMEVNQTGSQKSTSDNSETIELAAINFGSSLRLPTKNEPIDDDPFDSVDISSVGRHLSQESGLQVGSSGELDDYIMRNFKGEASPVSGKTGSTGYSSAGCESPDAASGAPSSPEFVASSWNNANRSASSDSGQFSDISAFSNTKFPSIRQMKE